MSVLSASGNGYYPTPAVPLGGAPAQNPGGTDPSRGTFDPINGNPLRVVSQTPTAGFVLPNAPGNPMAWQAPTDGLKHVFVVIGILVVASLETGGAVTMSWVIGGQNQSNKQLINASQGAGSFTIMSAGSGIGACQMCDPGTSVQINTTAVSGGGPSTFYGAILADITGIL